MEGLVFFFMTIVVMLLFVLPIFLRHKVQVDVKKESAAAPREVVDFAPSSGVSDWISYDFQEGEPSVASVGEALDAEMSAEEPLEVVNNGHEKKVEPSRIRELLDEELPEVLVASEILNRKY